LEIGTARIRIPASVLLSACALFGAPAAAWAQSDREDPAPPEHPAEPRIVDGRDAPGYDWLQFNMSAQHEGNDDLEWRITRQNASSLKLLFRAPLVDVSDGAPVYLSRVATAQGTKDLIFATTTPGVLAAYDACSGTRVWKSAAASGPQWTTSMPAIDPNRGFVYSYQLDGYVHKFTVADGTEIVGNGWPQLSTRKPDVEKGSSNLSIVLTRNFQRFLYAAQAGYPGPGPGDQGDYQGHVTAIDLDSGAQTIYNTLCSEYAIHFDESQKTPNDCVNVRAAVWGRSGITYDAFADRVLFTTGNGTFDANQGGRDWGDSILSLPPDLAAPAGLPADSYTPADFQQLDDNDEDLGSSTPLILPDPEVAGLSRYAVQLGKDGQIRLLDISDLSGQGGPGNVGGELQILAVPQTGDVLTAPAAWRDPADQSVWLFVANENGISGLKFDAPESVRRSKPRPAATVKTSPRLVTVWVSARGGTSPIVANGVLFYAGSGFVAALDPRTGTELWSDTGIGQIHWESPIVGNGVLYVMDNAPSISAYTPGGVAEPRSDGPCH
jgi:outer membrane protein assembly factor BamB